METIKLRLIDNPDVFFNKGSFNCYHADFGKFVWVRVRFANDIYTHQWLFRTQREAQKDFKERGIRLIFKRVPKYAKNKL